METQCITFIVLLYYMYNLDLIYILYYLDLNILQCITRKLLYTSIAIAN